MSVSPVSRVPADVPSFVDIQALTELMDDGVLLCRGDDRALHANASALALLPEGEDPESLQIGRASCRERV